MRPLNRSLKDTLKEAGAPCARYTLQLDLDGRMRLFMLHFLHKVGAAGIFKKKQIDETPLKWEKILRYLFAHNIIKEPFFFRKSPRGSQKQFLWNFTLRLLSGPETTDSAHANANSIFGLGSALDKDVAISKTIGETLERYFTLKFRYKDLILSSFTDLCTSSKVPPLHIPHLNGYLTWQKKMFPQFDVKPSSPLYWVKGKALANNTNVLLPAQLVYWMYPHNHPHAAEKRLLNSTTSGCGGGFSRAEAILSGLLELIQRDAFLIYWLNSLSPRIIDTSGVEDPDFRSYIHKLHGHGFRVVFLDITSDVDIPSCVSVLIYEKNGGPVIALGASTGFDFESTIRHSAVEALAVADYVIRNPQFHLSEDYTPFTDPSISRNERIFAWKGEQMLERFRFFISSSATISTDDFLKKMPQLADAEAKLSYTENVLKRLGSGYEIFTYEPQHEVLDGLSYHVARVIVPQLIPLYHHEYAASLDSKRLREVPEKIGFQPAATLNPWPHPFP